VKQPEYVGKLLTLSLLEKWIKMRFRIDIYDEIKANDIRMFSDEGLDKEGLAQLVWSNLNKFQGNVKAYVYDSQKKKKTIAVYYPMDVIAKYRKSYV
jgi:hypothetical protein